MSNYKRNIDILKKAGCTVISDIVGANEALLCEKIIKLEGTVDQTHEVLQSIYGSGICLGENEEKLRAALGLSGGTMEEITTICENCGIELPAENFETCGGCGNALCPDCVCEDCE